MEATEKSVDEYEEQIKDDHLTEEQRKVFEILRHMNVHRYCPPASQIAERAGLSKESTRVLLEQLCRLGIVVWRVDASTGDETYRLAKPEEFIRREKRAVKNGSAVAPNPHPSNTGTVSPKKIHSCPKCDFTTKSYAGLNIHFGQKHKTTAELREHYAAKEKKLQQRKVKENGSLVTITFTADEALDVSIALALADLISADRFKDAHRISNKILKAVIAQVPQKDLEGAT